MENSIGSYSRGTSIVFALQADPPYTGDETVYCDIKCVEIYGEIPPDESPVVFVTTPVFVAADDNPSHWLIPIPDEVCEGFEIGRYIFDALVVNPDGFRYRPSTQQFDIIGRVTVRP